MKNTYTLLAFALLLITFSSCSKEEEDMTRIEVNLDCIDVNNANLLSNALNIGGKNVTGITNYSLENKFYKSDEDNNLRIQYGLESAAVSSESTMYLPLFAEANDDLAGVLLSVRGADTYWKIDAENKDGDFFLSIDLPCSEQGTFHFEYRVFDIHGNISNRNECRVRVIPDVEMCGSSQSGADGLTITSYNLNTQATKLEFRYDTYTVPDRVDVKYGDEWIFSTGDLLSSNNPYPEIKDCNDVVPGDGFYGQWGVETFDYEPNSGKRLSIYVSGCLNDNTAWDYSIACLD